MVLKKTIKDIKEFKNEHRRKRTKKVLQHTGKDAIASEAGNERLVIN